MKRTTLPLTPSLLKAIRELARQEGVAMRKIMSDLLELGLKTRIKNTASKQSKSFNWTTQSMKARVDIDDKDTLIKALDSDR